eukprot:Gb_05311 [translate_table: standard]
MSKESILLKWYHERHSQMETTTKFSGLRIWQDPSGKQSHQVGKSSNLMAYILQGYQGLLVQVKLQCRQTIKRVFLHHFDEAIWFQNANLYHFSMFHASHHLEPVPATGDEVDAEANAVELVARTLCPLKIILERVVLTSTGVLLGCWQILGGSRIIMVKIVVKP